MKIIISKEEILDIINKHFGSNSAGFDKDGTIIIDETLEKLLDHDEDEDLGYSYFANPQHRKRKLINKLFTTTTDNTIKLQ